MPTIRDLCHRYIEGTKHKAPVILTRSVLCKLSRSIQIAIQKKMPCVGRTVFINTKSLKHIYDRHIYDKHASHDLEIILDHLPNIASNPDRLYRDLPNKRAHFLCVKKINSRLFMCGIELIGEEGTEIEIVSASATGEKYLKKDFTLLWSREDG